HIERPADEPGCRRRLAVQRESIAEGSERLARVARVLGFEQDAPGGEISLPVVDDAGRMVRDVEVVGEQGTERVRVSGGDRGIRAGRQRGCGVLSHAAVALRRGAGWRGRESQRRSLSGQLVEAGERLAVTVPIEILETRQEAIGPEDPEPEEMPLVGTATGTLGPEVRPA